MNAAERRAVAEVLESYFEPDSPEALAFAMYQLRRIYEAARPRRLTDSGDVVISALMSLRAARSRDNPRFKTR